MSTPPGNAPLRPIESRIVSATVYSESAHVTRRAELELSGTAARIAFPGLPRDLDPGGLSVATSRGLVRAIESELEVREPEPLSDATALSAAADTLRAKLHRIAGELEALALELRLIERVSPVGAPQADLGSIAPGPLRPEVFLAGLDVLDRRRRETVARTRTLEEERRVTSEELAAVERRQALTGETGGSERSQSLIVVSLELTEPGPAMVDLTYEASWATWRPYYHLRLDGKEGTVECVRFADVWQETGEDWPEVKLRLSTAEPDLGLHVPTVLPWTLGVAKSYEDKLADLYSARKRAKKVVADDPAPPARRPAPKPTSRMRAPQAPLAAAPVASRSGGLLGGLLGGGGSSNAYSAPPAPMDTADEDEAGDWSEATGPGDLAEQHQVFARKTGGAELDDYRRQFEEEGIYRAVTSSGLDAMRAEAPIDGAAPPQGVLAEVTGISPPPPPPPEPPPRARRGPSPEHPDHGRLVQSRLPRDSSAGINFEQEIGAATTCLSGKERHRLGLGSVTYPARLEYLLRPAAADHAFGRVTVTNNELVPMLGGPAAVFVGDAFFGETQIQTTPAGGKLVLDLGAETSIKCARRSKTTVRTEGILTREDIHVVQVDIEIENHTGRIAEIELQDQVPVSKDSKVKVHLERTTPKDGALDELTGILTFRLRASPGAKTEVSITYEIEAPKDYQLRQVLQG